MIEEEHTLEWDEYGEGVEEAARDAGHEWWDNAIWATHQDYAGLLVDTGYGMDEPHGGFLPDDLIFRRLPARVKLEGATAAATVVQLRWYIRRISELLDEPPDEFAAFDQDGQGLGVNLDAAQFLIVQARRLLTAAASRSSELRALSWMLASLTRTATLAAQQQVARDYLTRGDSACSGHITHLTLTDTLESASHAPPLMEVIRTAGPAALPSMAGRLQPE